MTEQTTVPKTKAFQGKLTQVEVHYVPLSATRGKACANCRWFMNEGCFIVEGYPESILATGYSDRWEATPAPAPDLTDVLTEAVTEAVVNIGTAITDAMPTPPVMDMGKSKPKSFSQRLRSLFTPKPADDAFSVFKGTDGQWYWHAIFTNNFEDLEGEILTEKAHDRYITRLDMGLVPMPVLQSWHTPGTEHGEADTLWRSNHFVHAVGHFDDTQDAEKAIAFYRKNAGKIKMSHGFTAPEWAFDGKHYDDYNTIEITTLPPYAAANPYTSFEELKTMQKMTDEKRRYIESMFGKEKLAEIEAADEQRSKALEDMKVAYKDFADATPPAAAAPTSEQEKALSVVYSDLVATQNEIVNLLTLNTKALKAKDDSIAALKAQFDTETAAWQKELTDLRTLVNAPPRRASQDESTVVKEGELTNALPTDDPLSKWLGLPLKPKTT